MREKVDLIAAWNRYVIEGRAKNVFENKSSRRIEAGVRFGSGGPELYAVDLATGQAACGPSRIKRFANGMEFLFTPIGSLKPHTHPNGLGKQADLPAEASVCTLQCQDPKSQLSILRRDPLIQVSCTNHEWRVYPNLIPWEARGLFLWVPCLSDGAYTTLPHQPQMLTSAYIEDFLEAAQASENVITFFSSPHAGATANHLHFQSIYRDRRLAVESADRVAMGGHTLVTGYPASGLFFPRNVSADALWEPIEKIQTAGYPFNLIALSTGTFLFIRNPQHEIVEEFPGSAMSGINLSGLIITSEESDLIRVTEELMTSALRKMTLPTAALAQLLGA